MQAVTESTIEIPAFFSKHWDSPVVNLLLCVSCHEAAVVCFGLKAEDKTEGIASPFSFHKKLY